MIKQTTLKASFSGRKIAPLKRFGQNFLVDQNIRDRIVKESGITAEDACCEIGCGAGALTEALCDNANRVVGIEIDAGLYNMLKETLSRDNLMLIHGDILKKDIRQQLKALLDGPFKVVANLPYYITTPVLMEFLQGGYNLQSMTVMMQKEVADRLCANPGSKAYGSLSIATQLLADVTRLFTVPRDCFYPKPDVESAVVRFDILPEPHEAVADEELFFKIVHASFAHRRKTILNNLKSSGAWESEMINRSLELAKIDPLRRGETLSINEFCKLTYAFLQNE